MADEIYGDKYFELPDWLVGRKYKEQRQKFDFNQEELDKFKDLNYKPKSILERFTENPDYMKQPTLTPLTLPRRDDFDSSDLKMFPSIPGSDNAIGDEAALISAFANTQADKVRKERADKEAKTEKEKFVDKDTVLGRIFDRRVKPGNELSNNEKAFAYIRNISDSLLERREVGGKEGTSTLSRILGPGGGIGEGSDEIKALQSASISKRAAAVDKALDRKKKAYEIQKISSESMKNIAELAKTDFTKATQEAMELAEFENFEPGTQAFDDQVAAILRGAVTEGQANVYAKLMQLQKDLAILPEGSPEYIAMEKDIAEMKQRVGGTTLDNSYAPDQFIDEDGNPKT